MFKVFSFVLILTCYSFSQQLLFQNDVYKVTGSEVKEGKFTAKALSASSIVTDYESNLNVKFKPFHDFEPVSGTWNLSKDISGYPNLKSCFVLIDALYNKSIEEMLLNIRSDGAFMAGEKWDGIWTRDISYSILLSLALINPEAAKVSLKAKVKNGKIIQDTGTGGSWPVSSDRATWALAAWEVYLATGDMNWLKYAYEVIKNSAEDDLNTLLDKETGLFFGESSFLDWREQSYPSWMEPKDIYKSRCLGTNAVHYRTFIILSEMSSVLKVNGKKYQDIAAIIKAGINKHLWIEQQGYYGQYFYGDNFSNLSQRSESLGEALSVLFNVADEKRAKSVISATPVLKYGIPCFYPQIPEIPPYHNDAIWPFVQSYWTWASGKVKNLKAVEHGLASVIRAAALFNTNKENFVASTGDHFGTMINSNRQLWSVAGNLALTFRVLFGMNLNPNGITFAPVVPKSFNGEKILTNFRYRDASLTIKLKGFGTEITEFLLDGKKQNRNAIPADLKGNHIIEIILNNQEKKEDNINLVTNHFSLPSPDVTYKNNRLTWKNIEGTAYYFIYQNGKRIDKISAPEYPVKSGSSYSEWQVSAVDNKGFESFLSKPISINNPAQPIIINASDILGIPQIGSSEFITQVKLTDDKEQEFSFFVEVDKDGFYFADFNYANGNGPVNTDNKCAIRTLNVNSANNYIIIFPQRGTNEWDNFGFTNSVKIKLKKGLNLFELKFKNYNENMNGEINNAIIKYLRLQYSGG